MISVLENEEFEQGYHGPYSSMANCIAGYARFSQERGKPHETILREGRFGDLVRVVGHEIGHVFTPVKKDRVPEEAKAYAFEAAWSELLDVHNIGGMAGIAMMDFKIGPTEKKFPEHYAAHSFVLEMIKRMPPIELHERLVRNELVPS